LRAFAPARIEFRRGAGHVHDEVGDLAAESLANEVELLKADALRHLVLEVVDCRGAYARLACEVCLRPPKLAQLRG